jgi:hypothetical protein
MSHRDVSRSWNRNRLRLLRDRHGRLRGSTRITLTAIEQRAVERSWRAGDSVDSIAIMVGVSKNTLYRIVLTTMPHLRMRGRGKVIRPYVPPPREDEIIAAVGEIRRTKGQ